MWTFIWQVMWLNLSAKNRHRREGKWEKRGSLRVCDDGSWLTSAYHLQNTRQHIHRAEIKKKLHYGKKLTVRKSTFKACCHKAVLFIKAKECQARHVTAEQPPWHFLSWLSSGKLCDMQRNAGSRRQTRLSPKKNMRRLSNNCCHLSPAALKAFSNPWHFLKTIKPLKKIFYHSSSNLYQKKKKLVQPCHLSMLWLTVLAWYSSFMVQLTWWIKYGILWFFRKETIISYVFCLCHVKDDRKKVRIKCGGNSYQTEPEVTSLSVPWLEDIEGGRP